MGNMFGEYHASCMLKMSFVDFEKEKADCTRYIAVNEFVLDTDGVVVCVPRRCNGLCSSVV